MLQKIFLSTVLLITINTWADSPLTSTTFYQSYAEVVEVISEASETHQLTDEMIDFLADDGNSDDKKLALINALGWGEEGNLPKYEAFLNKKYSLEASFFDSLAVPYFDEDDLLNDEYVQKLTHDELMCWSYLKVLDDYFNPVHGLKAALYNVYKEPNNFSYQFNAGLIFAQIYLDQGKWCEVYTVLAEIRSSRKGTTDQLSHKALIDAWNYIGIYEEVCDEKGIDVSELSENLDPELTAEDFKVFHESKKGKRPDLNVKEIGYPEFDSDIDGTILFIEVENKGKVAAIPSSLEFQTERSEFIEDEVEYDDKREYDYNFSRIIRVPEIPAKSSVKIKVYIEKYWIFDPNCEIRVILDPFEKIEEKKENNNSLDFHAYG